jgi:hypothetical protein
MWIGAAIFLSFMWGMGIGSDTREQEVTRIKVVRKVGTIK